MDARLPCAKLFRRAKTGFPLAKARWPINAVKSKKRTRKNKERLCPEGIMGVVSFWIGNCWSWNPLSFGNITFQRQPGSAQRFGRGDGYTFRRGDNIKMVNGSSGID
jgi:hypothetical protein